MPTELYTYTGTKLALEVKRQFGDTGNVQITDDHILQWINNGQRSIAATNDFIEKSFTTNLLAGQAAYDLNTLAAGERVKSYSAVLAAGVKLRHLTYQAFLELDSSELDPAQGTQAFTEFGGVLTLLPAPLTTVVNGLVVNYSGWPADLAAIGDQLTVPDRFYNALHSYVFARALELDENFEAAAAQLDQHAAALAVETGREALDPTDYYPTQSYVEP